jgi:RimJ/RimL family protein N-acetyltransferase
MVFIHPDIAVWVMDGIDGGKWLPQMTAIGDIKDGKLIAGVAFEAQNKNCMIGHLRIDGPPCKAFWINTADFIFNQCNQGAGVKKFSAIVDVHNEKAIKLNLKIGFVIEATLKDAGEHGDLHVMTLWKENCKMLNWGRK